jgi:hypothetical protein
MVRFAVGLRVAPAVAVSATVALCLAGASTALASGWSIQPTPNPVGATSSMLAAVSCPSTTACIAVGDSTLGSLAESWNGRRWTIQPTPNPPGAIGPIGSTDLQAVSCSSKTACTAVGTTSGMSANGWVPLAERWNGVRWWIQQMPLPAGATNSGLTGVSCPSRTMCVAVGSYGTRSQSANMLLERWNGKRWSLQPTPHPVGATTSPLAGVSCSSPIACTAVGAFFDRLRGRTLALVERWNGKRWSDRPNQLGRAVLAGVSCASLTACTAVGVSMGGEFNPVAASWDGERWTGETIAGSTGLGGVSCASSTACTAVSSSTVYRWNGEKWSTQPTPSPAGAKYSAFREVSCPSTHACIAVGSYKDTIEAIGPQYVLVERWTGTG